MAGTRRRGRGAAVLHPNTCSPSRSAAAAAVRPGSRRSGEDDGDWSRGKRALLQLQNGDGVACWESRGRASVFALLSRLGGVGVGAGTFPGALLNGGSWSRGGAATAGAYPSRAAPSWPRCCTVATTERDAGPRYASGGPCVVYARSPSERE